MNAISRQFRLVLAAALALGMGMNSASAEVGEGYWGASGSYVKNPNGLCWHAGYWTPAMATLECDPDLVPKKAMPAPAPMAAPRAAAPAPAPVPAPAPKPAPKPVAESISMAADTHFDFDKAVLKPEGQATLDSLVSKLKAVDLEVVIAVGHTCSIGSNAYNQKLSERRANAVKTYLVGKGVDAKRILAEGRGETQPVADNRTREGRAKNRRVEIEVLGTRQH